MCFFGPMLRCLELITIIQKISTNFQKVIMLKNCCRKTGTNYPTGKTLKKIYRVIESPIFPKKISFFQYFFPKNSDPNFLKKNEFVFQKIGVFPEKSDFFPKKSKFFYRLPNRKWVFYLELAFFKQFFALKL
jgi:hypothetical protein